MTVVPVSGWLLDQVVGVTADGSAPAVFASLVDDFERANGPLSTTQSPSGHWWNGSGTVLAAIISGRLQQASVGNSYMFTDLGAVPSRIGGYWSANGANGDGSVTIALSPEYNDLTRHLIHVTMNRTTWAVQTTATGAGAGMVTLLTGTQALTFNGTPNRFFIRVSGQTLTIELPDGTEQSVITTAVAANGGRYAFFQNSYTSGAAPAWDSVAATSACTSTNSPGIYVGTPGFGAPGPLTRSAITFSGDDNVVLPRSMPWPEAGSYSVAAWAYFDAVNVAQTVYAIGDLFNNGSDPFFGRSVKLAIAADGKPYVTVGEGNNTATQSYQSAVSATAWHLLVGVLDRTAQTVRVYVDGLASSNAAGSSAAVGAITAYNSAQRTLGNRTFGGPGEYLVGRAAQVNIFDRALTQAEITGLFVGTIPADSIAATTARVSLVAGVTAMMNAYIAANPGRIVRHYRSTPPQFQDLPASYLDLGVERIHHSNGIRDSVFSPAVVVVTRLTDNGETTDAHDILVDSLREWFTATPHIVAGTVWDDMTVADEAAGEDNQFYATRFTFVNYSASVGRT